MACAKYNTWQCCLATYAETRNYRGLFSRVLFFCYYHAQAITRVAQSCLKSLIATQKVLISEEELLKVSFREIIKTILFVFFCRWLLGLMLPCYERVRVISLEIKCEAIIFNQCPLIIAAAIRRLILSHEGEGKGGF